MSNKIIMPKIRQIEPTVFAHQLANIQPMSTDAGKIFDIKYFNQMYSIIETKQVDGNMVYSVAASEEIIDWVQDTFVSGSDYTLVRRLAGVWIEVNENVLVLLKLKWS